MQLDLPFKATSLPHLFRVIATKDPKPLPDTYSKTLRQLVKKMLCKNPSKRPTVKDVISHQCLCLASVQHHSNGILVQDHVVFNGESQSQPISDEVKISNNLGAPASNTSSLHHRLNRQLLHTNNATPPSRQRTWEECLKEAEANVILSIHLNPADNQRRNTSR